MGGRDAGGFRSRRLILPFGIVLFSVLPCISYGRKHTRHVLHPALRPEYTCMHRRPITRIASTTAIPMQCDGGYSRGPPRVRFSVVLITFLETGIPDYYLYTMAPTQPTAWPRQHDGNSLCEYVLQVFALELPRQYGACDEFISGVLSQRITRSIFSAET